MQRIGTSNGLFVDGDPFNNIQGTVVTAAWLNSVQEEVAGTIEGLGITLDPTQKNQLLTAIETLIEARAGEYLLDTGVANAYVVALNPSVTAYPNGLTIKFRATHANTGASTLNGPPLLRDDGSPLQPGDIASNAIVTATYDSPAAAFLVNSIVLSQLGALARLGIGAFLSSNAGALTLLLGALLGNDGAGNLTINLGQGLKNDGHNNLSLKLDTPLGFDGSGNLQVNLGSGLYVDGNSNLSVTGPRYVNAAANLAWGDYIVDTSAGGFALTLPQNPTKGGVITFTDAAATWGVNTWTLAHNGKTIMGQVADLAINLSDQKFSIWYNGSDWRLV